MSVMCERGNVCHVPAGLSSNPRGSNLEGLALGNMEAFDYLSFSKLTRTLESTVSGTQQCLFGTMRRLPMLLENNCIHVSCALPSCGWDETFLQHVNVPLQIDCDCLSVIVLKDTI